jgi:small subunit ribosomal protein S21
MAESEVQLPRITVNKDESIDRALRRFKKLCQKEGLNEEIRKRRSYIKPSEKRRRQTGRARKRS